MVRNGYVRFIQGGGKEGGIIAYTLIITNYLVRVHDGDPNHVKFETQYCYVFHAGFICYKLTREGAFLHRFLSLAI